MSDEMVAFLNARLDEDEHWAKMAEAGWPPEAVTTVPDDYKRYAWMPTDITPSKATFILRHDPARMLREVAAKRKILAEHKAVTRLAGLTEQELGFLGWYREWVLKNLAAVYSDHPDYQENWKP